MATVTRTVMFTDLTDFTKKSSDLDRRGIHDLLAWHLRMVEPFAKKYGGRVIKNLGDSYLVTYASATDALRAGLEIQENVTSQDGTGAPIKIGMTTGDVEEIDGDAFGEAVNLAHRVLGQCESGDVMFGPGTKVCMNASEIPWESVGRRRLKGIPGDQELYRAVPRHRSWLPDAVCAAVKLGTLVRIRRGQRPPMLPPEPVVLLDGFAPGSDALEKVVGSLPVLDPSALWLATYNISQSDRSAWLEGGRGLVVGTPEAIDAAIEDAYNAVNRTAGSDTIVIDVGTNAEFELVVCGLAMPKVPLSEVVASYSYDLLGDGLWVNRSDRAVVRVELSSDGLIVRALAPGVSVNGRGLLPGSSTPLSDGDAIHTSVGQHHFRRLEASSYHGLVLRDTETRIGVTGGQTIELGREPRHPGLRFPDRRGQENIRWCAGQRAARARAQGFTLDRLLAGRRQAAVEMQGEGVRLRPLHARCPTFLRRADPGEEHRLERCEEEIGLGVDDLIVAGTTAVALRAFEGD